MSPEGFEQRSHTTYSPTPEALAHPEAITAAAIMLDGRLYWDTSHAAITMNHLSEDQLTKLDAISEVEADSIYGFLTTYGRFVTRTEAADIAKETGQLDNPVDLQHLQSNEVRFVTYH